MANDRTRESREQILNDTHQKRVPLHEQMRSKLSIPNADPNYSYYLLTDKDGAIEKFKLAGWELAPESFGLGESPQNTSMGSGTRIPVGGGDIGVLMRIRKEYYDEDMKTYRNANNKQVKDLLQKRHRADGLEDYDDETKLEVRTGYKKKVSS